MIVDFVQNTLDGIFVGSSYSLLAIGFTLIFGVMRRLNLSYGPSIMLGIFAGTLLYVEFEAGLLAVAAATLAGAVLAGLYVERSLLLGDSSGRGPRLHGLELCDLDAARGDRHRLLPGADLPVSAPRRLRPRVRGPLRARRPPRHVRLRGGDHRPAAPAAPSHPVRARPAGGLEEPRRRRLRRHQHRARALRRVRARVRDRWRRGMAHRRRRSADHPVLRDSGQRSRGSSR